VENEETIKRKIWVKCEKWRNQR